MFNPDLGFDDKFVHNVLPPHRRTKRFIAWTKGMISQSLRLSLIFKNYISGFSAPYYDALVTYNFDDEVVDNYKIYKSIIDSNLGNIPGANLDKWQEVSPSLIPLEERLRFSYQKINLEYAINAYFQEELDANGFVGFIQPDDPIAPTNSDIFIDNEPIAFGSYTVFDDEVGCGITFADKSAGFVFADEYFIDATTYLFNINIPTAVYADIGTPDVAETVVRKFMDTYVPSGIKYQIKTY